MTPGKRVKGEGGEYATHNYFTSEKEEERENQQGPDFHALESTFAYAVSKKKEERAEGLFSYFSRV